jgi:hypothetical protein
MDNSDKSSEHNLRSVSKVDYKELHNIGASKDVLQQDVFTGTREKTTKDTGLADLDLEPDMSAAGGLPAATGGLSLVVERDGYNDIFSEGDNTEFSIEEAEEKLKDLELEEKRLAVQFAIEQKRMEIAKLKDGIAGVRSSAADVKPSDYASP